MEERKILGYSFIFKNSFFRNLVCQDIKKPFWFILASLYSLIIYVSYPLITQAYLDIIFNNKGTSYLEELTALFLLVFIIKIFIDIFIKKYFENYIVSLEVRIKRLVFKKYKNNLKVLLESRQDLISSSVHLYVLLVKHLYFNIIDVIKIICVFVIIMLTKKEFFVYFLAAVPFFILFYLIQLRVMSREVEIKTRSKDKDFGLLLKRISDSKMSNRDANTELHVFFADVLNKKRNNKNREVSTNVFIDSFVSFYRIFFLAYFTSFFILYNVNLPGLVVGLLFITLLTKPFLNIIKSVPIRVITRKAFFRINSLMK